MYTTRPLALARKVCLEDRGRYKSTVVSFMFVFAAKIFLLEPKGVAFDNLFRSFDVFLILSFWKIKVCAEKNCLKVCLYHVKYIRILSQIFCKLFAQVYSLIFGIHAVSQKERGQAVHTCQWCKRT